MLTPYLGSKFVTKILTSQSGEQFRVTFFVSLVNGEVKAQVVSAECISQPVKALIGLGEVANKGVLCLPIECSKKSIFDDFGLGFDTIVSPFTSLLFFTSQPTRAPSL